MALDRFIENTLNEIITEWTNEGRVFTAFEVSLEAKKRNVEERHRNMRDRIHEIIHLVAGPGSSYSRTLMDVGAPEQAWVYHPLRANPYEYEPLPRNDQPRQPRPSVLPRAPRNPVALSTGNAAPAVIPPGAYGTDQRGRLCLPVNLLAQIGVTAGQRVNVVCDPANEQMLITRANAPGTPDSTTPDTSYTAEPDGNVRITQGTLEKAALDGVQCYRIEGTPQVISVRKFT